MVATKMLCLAKCLYYVILVEELKRILNIVTRRYLFESDFFWPLEYYIVIRELLISQISILMQASKTETLSQKGNSRP